MPGVEGITLPAGIALADVEIAVGAELDAAAVVIIVGLRNVHDDLDGLVGLLDGHLVRAVRIDSVARDDVCAVEGQRCVADVEVTVLLELRVEGDGPQALLDEAGLHFAAERSVLGQVEERLLGDLAVLDDLDLADALDDEDASRAVEGRGDADRIVESIGQFDQCDLRITRQLAARPRDFGGGRDGLRDRRQPPATTEAAAIRTRLY